MAETAVRNAAGAKTPWHVWVVGILSLLWYLSGAYVIMLAQHGTYPGLPADEAAYYAAKPLYLELIADIALLAGIAGSVALLMRRAWAVPLYAVLAAAVLLGHALELAGGTSRAFANQGAMIATVVILAWAVLNWLHARAMQRRGVLR